MKNIFNEADRKEILLRIEKLTPGTKALWGKMDVAQMLAHCAKASKMLTGEIKADRVPFPINILGKLIKNKALDESPLRKNSPTAKEIKVVDPREFEKEKVDFINSIKKIGQLGEKGIKPEIHPFFGKISPKEWGRINYKHADHHLNQFGV